MDHGHCCAGPCADFDFFMHACRISSLRDVLAMETIKSYHHISTLAAGCPAAYREVDKLANKLGLLHFSVGLDADKFKHHKTTKAHCWIMVFGFDEIFERSWEDALANLRAQIGKKYPVAKIERLPASMEVAA